MRTRRFFAWLPTALLLVATAASAFEPDIHQKYTQRGISLYKRCVQLGAAFPTVGDDDLNAVARGTEMEDTTEPISRATHWHYAHNEAMPRELWILPPLFKFELDMDGIFGQRNADLHRLAAGSTPEWRRQHFERAGRVLHYIQDMRVPGHVIPIHHGGPGGIKDGFDEFIFYYPDVLASLDRAHCESIAATVKVPCRDCLLGRLDEAKKATLNMLGQSASAPGEDLVARCWREVLWCKPESGKECPGSAYPGFGAYLSGENALSFGENRIVKCGDAKVQFDEVAYHRFFAKSYRGMMDDILFMLLYAVRLAD